MRVHHCIRIYIYIYVCVCVCMYVYRYYKHVFPQNPQKEDKVVRLTRVNVLDSEGVNRLVVSSFCLCVCGSQARIDTYSLVAPWRLKNLRLKWFTGLTALSDTVIIYVVTVSDRHHDTTDSCISS